MSKIKIDWRTLIPTGVYLFLVINGNTKKTCEICSKLTIKTPKQRQWRRGISIVDLEQVNAGGECWKSTTIFRSPRQIFTFLRYFYICSDIRTMSRTIIWNLPYLLKSAEKIVVTLLKISLLFWDFHPISRLVLLEAAGKVNFWLVSIDWNCCWWNI